MDWVKVVLSRTVTSCAEFISRTLLSHYSASTVFTELVVPKLLELKLYMFLRQLNEVKYFGANTTNKRHGSPRLCVTCTFYSKKAKLFFRAACMMERTYNI